MRLLCAIAVVVGSLGGVALAAPAPKLDPKLVGQLGVEVPALVADDKADCRKVGTRVVTLADVLEKIAKGRIGPKQDVLPVAEHAKVLGHAVTISTAITPACLATLDKSSSRASRTGSRLHQRCTGRVDRRRATRSTRRCQRRLRFPRSISNSSRSTISTTASSSTRTIPNARAFASCTPICGARTTISTSRSRSIWRSSTSTRNTNSRVRGEPRARFVQPAAEVRRDDRAREEAARRSRGSSTSAPTFATRSPRSCTKRLADLGTMGTGGATLEGPRCDGGVRLSRTSMRTTPTRPRQMPTSASTTRA